MGRLGLILLVLLLAASVSADVLQVSAICETPCEITWELSTGEPDAYDVTYSFDDAWRFYCEVVAPPMFVNEFMLRIAPAPVRIRVRGIKEGLDPSPWSPPSDLLTTKIPQTPHLRR
jgi:hypothetical protein